MNHPVLGHLSNGLSLVGAWTPGIIHRNIKVLNFLYIHRLDVCNYTWPTRPSFGELLRILRLQEAETQLEGASFSRI